MPLTAVGRTGQLSAPVSDALPEPGHVLCSEAVGGQFGVGVDVEGRGHLGEDAAVETGVTCRGEGDELFPGKSSAAHRFDQPVEGPGPGLADHEEYAMKFLIGMHINPAVLDALTDEEKA
ncbi:hypothetical protein, partial [Actinoallomurus sp. WRP6H-15]|nr:hypothetical protein [Actinoallomurus soli]